MKTTVDQGSEASKKTMEAPSSEARVKAATIPGPQQQQPQPQQQQQQQQLPPQLPVVAVPDTGPRFVAPSGNMSTGTPSQPPDEEKESAASV